MSASAKGKIISQETRQKISIAMKNGAAPFKGKTLSTETKEKMSKARKGKYVGENHPMFGKHHTDKSRAKMSKALKGRIISPEARINMSNAQLGDKHHRYWLGKKQSAEHIKSRMETIHKKRAEEGYIDPRKGRKKSKEDREKLSITIKNSWIKRRQKYGTTGQPQRRIACAC